ncbi:MAG: hypothetical protein PHI88_02360 [Candidatus Pacebacteria bacterium]|nr:hypothetical protein [Candidatus Paceibacterota bacterium]
MEFEDPTKMSQEELDNRLKAIKNPKEQDNLTRMRDFSEKLKVGGELEFEDGKYVIKRIEEEKFFFDKLDSKPNKKTGEADLIIDGREQLWHKCEKVRLAAVEARKKNKKTPERKPNKEPSKGKEKVTPQEKKEENKDEIPPGTFDGKDEIPSFPENLDDEFNEYIPERFLEFLKGFREREGVDLFEILDEIVDKMSQEQEQEQEQEHRESYYSLDNPETILDRDIINRCNDFLQGRSLRLKDNAAREYLLKSGLISDGSSIKEGLAIKELEENHGGMDKIEDDETKSRIEGIENLQNIVESQGGSIGLAERYLLLHELQEAREELERKIGEKKIKDEYVDVFTEQAEIRSIIELQHGIVSKTEEGGENIYGQARKDAEREIGRDIDDYIWKQGLDREVGTDIVTRSLDQSEKQIKKRMGEARLTESENKALADILYRIDELRTNIENGDSWEGMRENVEYLRENYPDLKICQEINRVIQVEKRQYKKGGFEEFEEERYQKVIKKADDIFGEKIKEKIGSFENTKGGIEKIYEDIKNRKIDKLVADKEKGELGLDKEPKSEEDIEKMLPETVSKLTNGQINPEQTKEIQKDLKKRGFSEKGEGFLKYFFLFLISILYVATGLLMAGGRGLERLGGKKHKK